MFGSVCFVTRTKNSNRCNWRLGEFGVVSSRRFSKNELQKCSVIFLWEILNFFKKVCARSTTYDFLAVHVKSSTQTQNDGQTVTNEIRVKSVKPLNIFYLLLFSYIGFFFHFFSSSFLSLVLGTDRSCPKWVSHQRLSLASSRSTITAEEWEDVSYK